MNAGMNNLEFFKVTDEESIAVRITHERGQPLVTEKKLIQAFKKTEYSQAIVIDNAFTNLVDELKNKRSQEGTEKTISLESPIATVVDAIIEIIISPDQMAATIEITGAQGGTNPDKEAIVHALQSHDIQKGIFINQLDDIVEQVNRARPGEKVEREIAKGITPIDGKDGYINFLVPDPKERILRPKRLKNGNVDMRELGDIVHVKKDTALAKLIAPEQGTPGFTVKGKKIAAKPGKPSAIKASEGTSLLESDESILIASTNGMPKHEDNSVSVHRLLELDAVDVGTGNIRFDGSIFVKGNVCQSMKLFATEDIVVGGLIESANVVARGSISVARGIIGRHKTDEDDDLINSTSIDAKGSVSAQFIQYADIICGDNVTVNEYISHSQLQVANNTWVGSPEKKQPDGKLFSTYVQSGGAVYTGTLGSFGDTSTSITFDYWLTIYDSLKTKVDERKALLINRINKIEPFYSLIINKEPQNTSLIKRTEKALRLHLIQLAKLNMKLFAVLDKKKASTERHLVQAYDVIYSGTNIDINGHVCEFAHRKPGSTISCNNNKILVEPITILSNESNAKEELSIDN